MDNIRIEPAFVGSHILLRGVSVLRYYDKHYWSGDSKEIFYHKKPEELSEEEVNLILLAVSG